MIICANQRAGTAQIIYMIVIRTPLNDSVRYQIVLTIKITQLQKSQKLLKLAAVTIKILKFLNALINLNNLFIKFKVGKRFA